MFRRAGIIAIVVALSATVGPARASAPSCTAGSLAGGDWPVYGHDLANTRSQDAEHSITPGRAATLTPAWVMDTALVGAADLLNGTPVEGNGCVYVAGQSNVYAVTADTGEFVWSAPIGSTIGTSLAVDDGRVFVHTGGLNVTPPVVYALDAATGAVLWHTQVANNVTTDAFQASPVVFDGMVFSGISGLDELQSANRAAADGSFAILDAATGELLKKTYVIPPDDFAKGYTGGNIWATAAIDPETKYAYVGTAATYNVDMEHPRTNAIIKIDLDRTRDTFGEIVAFYSGTRDYYYDFQKSLPCTKLAPGSNQAEAVTGTCATMDLDFGASPNLFRDSLGRTIVGEMQKSGIYHAVDTETMQPVWTAFVTDPHGYTLGSTAYDGARIYGTGSYENPEMYTVDPNSGGTPWVSTTTDDAHFSPVSVADGVVYTAGTDGVLNAYDARTGVPVLARPMAADAGTSVTGSGNGVAIARHTVYVPAGAALIAYRPDPNLAPAADALDAALAAAPSPQPIPRIDKPL